MHPFWAENGRGHHGGAIWFLGYKPNQKVGSLGIPFEFWVNHYLEIVFSKISVVKPPPPPPLKEAVVYVIFCSDPYQKVEVIPIYHINLSLTIFKSWSSWIYSYGSYLGMVVNILPSTVKLRDLIRQIRSARTAAEERAIITKGRYPVTELHKIGLSQIYCLKMKNPL